MVADRRRQQGCGPQEATWSQTAGSNMVADRREQQGRRPQEATWLRTAGNKRVAACNPGRVELPQGKYDPSGIFFHVSHFAKT